MPLQFRPMYFVEQDFCCRKGKRIYQKRLRYLNTYCWVKYSLCSALTSLLTCVTSARLIIIMCDLLFKRPHFDLTTSSCLYMSLRTTSIYIYNIHASLCTAVFVMYSVSIQVVFRFPCDKWNVVHPRSIDLMECILWRKLRRVRNSSHSVLESNSN